MKTSIQSITAVVALSIATLVNLAADEPSTSQTPPAEPEIVQRKQRVAEEIAKRRAEREAAMSQAGPKAYKDVRDGVVYPAGKGGDSEEKVKIVVRNLPVGIVAGMYAKLSGREVMVSSSVSMILVDLQCDDIPRRLAIGQIEETWKSHGVRIVDLGGSSIALVSETSEKK